MSQKSFPIFGALAVAATLGAVQLASGHDLADRFQALTELQAAAGTTGIDSMQGAVGINRAAKGDREAAPKADGEARTVRLRIDSLVDTSVLVRIRVQKDARNLPPASPAAKPAGDRSKKMVACEPVVSVLTEVAKLLQPGRCVT